MKLSFKKQPMGTGLRAVGSPYPDTDIKIDGKVVGHIAAPNWMTDSLWRISLAVARPVSNFDWVRLKATFDDEKTAREFVKKNIQQIIAKFNLYRFED